MGRIGSIVVALASSSCSSGCADDVACCPIASAPSHDCFATGGSGECRSLCDANPKLFAKVEDGNGCPMWRLR